MQSINSKKSNIVLNVLHLPILVVLLLIAGLSAGSAKILSSADTGKGTEQAVLSEEDENSEEDSEDSDSEEDSEDGDDEDKGKGEANNKGKNGDENGKKNGVEEDSDDSMDDDGIVEDDEEVGDEVENEEENEDEDESGDAKEPYRIMVKYANPNSNGLAATDRIKLKIRRQIESDPSLAGKIEAVELLLQENSTTNALEYRTVATKSERLFGIFKISIPVQMSVDPVTEEVTIDRTLLSKILDLFSL